MTDQLPVMITAVVIAMIVMLVAANPVGDFVNNHPTVKMLALSFLLLVGVALIADGLHFHIPRGYLYFAIFFSGLVEALNLWAAKARRRRGCGHHDIRGPIVDERQRRPAAPVRDQRRGRALDAMHQAAFCQTGRSPQARVLTTCRICAGCARSLG